MALVAAHGLNVRHIRQDPGTMLVSDAADCGAGGPEGSLTDAFLGRPCGNAGAGSCLF